MRFGTEEPVLSVKKLSTVREVLPLLSDEGGVCEGGGGGQQVDGQHLLCPGLGQEEVSGLPTGS